VSSQWPTQRRFERPPCPGTSAASGVPRRRRASSVGRPAACLNVRLLKQRRALTVETMSAMTVMDKSTKSSAHVKYPTEKIARAALA